MSMTKQQRQARERAIPFCTSCRRNKPRLGETECGQCLEAKHQRSEIEELEDEINDLRGQIKDPAAGIAIHLLIDYIRLRLTGSRW